LTNVSGTTTAQLQGTWANFAGSARTDIISVTETPQVGTAITVTMPFLVASTSSPAYSSTRPTSSSTWPTVLTPDQISSAQATQAAGPYASLGLADGSMYTSFAMPSYNPNTIPVSLDYNSTTANAQPIFLTEYQLPFGDLGTVDLQRHGVGHRELQHVGPERRRHHADRLASQCHEFEHGPIFVVDHRHQ
jgi:hypothetical protein